MWDIYVTFSDELVILDANNYTSPNQIIEDIRKMEKGKELIRVESFPQYNTKTYLNFNPYNG
jgi:hypothetical protein